MRQFTVLLLAVCATVTSLLAEDERTPIPPAFRSQEHFAAGQSYLEGLGPGWTVEIDRADGLHFELQVGEGGFAEPDLPPARLESKHVAVTPLGYRITGGVELPRYIKGARSVLEIEAPNGRYSLLYDFGPGLIVYEGDGRAWEYRNHKASFRLPDGTRFDELAPYDEWELLTLRGERFVFDVTSGTWREETSLDSPISLPDFFVPALGGDGDDWYYPEEEDHIVFAWSWYPGSLTVAEVIDATATGKRRYGIDLYFNELAYEQRPAEMAAYLLGRRLALSGGDRVTFVSPVGKRETIYLFPTPIEPGGRLPKAHDPTSRFRMRSVN